MSDETYKPPAGVATSAKRALRWIKDGYAGSGFTDVGRRRASQLANREPVSLETVRRMYAYFSRHEVDKKGTDFDNLSEPSAGRVAWDAWGGDAGYSWSRGIVERMSDKTSSVVETTAFFSILKSDKNADGTLMVTGIATDDTLDVDQQICDPNWLKSAMPEWFSWGNIREQHSNIAAGVATEYEARGSQHIITARVVDPASVKKVEAGVLKGFSIGIRNPRVIKDEKAVGGRIVDGQIVEVSLVDRPANPTCMITVAKTVDGLLKSVEGSNDMSTETPETEIPTEVEAPETAEKAPVSEESTEESTAGQPAGEESTEESTAEKAPSEESTKMCKDCGMPVEKCKCAEGGFSRDEKGDETDLDKAPAEESSQAPGEESSQEIGEESSRPGGVAGVAGKSAEIADQLHRIESAVTLLADKLGDVLKGIATTEDIAKSVQEVAERVSVVEKSPASAPMRMAVTKTVATADVNPDLARASEYRAKAMASTDPKLASGYLALAYELEKNL